MKESKFVKTKIVAGYLLLIAVCILSVGYDYRVAVRFSAPDRSYALLHTKRSAVNRTLYHLYQAESYGQTDASDNELGVGTEFHMVPFRSSLVGLYRQLRNGSE